jgi:hypothetical protein
MKIRPVGDELFHADGQTDMTRLIVAFRNFATARKKQTSVSPPHTVFLHLPVNDLRVIATQPHDLCPCYCKPISRNNIQH